MWNLVFLRNHEALHKSPKILSVEDKRIAWQAHHGTQTKIIKPCFLASHSLHICSQIVDIITRKTFLTGNSYFISKNTIHMWAFFSLECDMNWFRKNTIRFVTHYHITFCIPKRPALWDTKINSTFSIVWVCLCGEKGGINLWWCSGLVGHVNIRFLFII